MVFGRLDFPATYIPTLEDCREEEDWVCCDDLWEDWGRYDNIDDALKQKDIIINDVRLGCYSIPENHFHAFTIRVEDKNGSTIDVIEVIDNIEEG